MSSENTLCGILNIDSSERVQDHYEGAKTHLLAIPMKSYDENLMNKICILNIVKMENQMIKLSILPKVNIIQKYVHH